MEALVRKVGNQKSGGTRTSGDYVVVVEEASLDECLALREENRKLNDNEENASFKAELEEAQYIEKNITTPSRE